LDNSYEGNTQYTLYQANEVNSMRKKLRALRDRLRKSKGIFAAHRVF